MKKTTLIIILIFCFITLFPNSSKATELSIFTGMEKNEYNVWGLYANWGFLPFISSEIEYCSNNETTQKYYSLGVSSKFKISVFAPFARAGIGLKSKKISLSDLNFFYYIGGGLKFYITPLLGLKGGLTYLNEKKTSYNRFYAGIFVEI